MYDEAARWRSGDLGERGDLELGRLRLPYFNAGSGPPVVLVHGALVNANLWRKVVPELAREHRTVALDLPIGAHAAAVPAGTDLSPRGLAGLVADAIEALGLEDVTLVGNDTGGAVCQLVAVHRPERLGRLVLTSCDAFEQFPPPPFDKMFPVLRAPGVLAALAAPLRVAAVRSRAMRIMLGGLAKRPIERRAIDSYALPLTDAGVRGDFVRFLRAADKREMIDVGGRLREFPGPALLAWSREDKFFSRELAERLAAAFGDGRIEWIDDAYTFSPEDQPGRVAALVGDFARAPTAA